MTGKECMNKFKITAEMFNPKYEKLYVVLFFTLLTVVLTWPVLAHFLSSVPSNGPDTTQVIGSAGIQANELHDLGIFRGTFDLLKHSSFNILTLYAYFQLIFGRVFGYNLLFYLSFILSGFGAYLLADYFLKNKKAALLAGIIYAFAPFHIHNAFSTNVGTMHQEWLPFFVLYLFRFFEKFDFKYFLATAAFLFLIGLTEHQLLAFTAIFLVFFLIYELIANPKIFLNKKFWLYFLVAAFLFSVVFFFIFRNLFTIANSDNNFLSARMRSVVKYSNDSLSIFLTPSFHSLWPKAFSNLRDQFERKSSSTFSVYAGYSVLLLSLLGIVFWKYMKKGGQSVKSIFFWLFIALGFYVLSWGPYLHFKGVLDPPVKMPYYLIYNYLPFYKNIRTVGRLFVYSMLAFSLLAAWGATFLESKIINLKFKIWKNKGKRRSENVDLDANEKNIKRSIIFYSFVGVVIILEFLAVPFKMNSLLHSPFYEKLGQDKEKYSVLEIPGSTDYGFASRDLVWKSIHQKNTINGYDFARVNDEAYVFQQSTPIIRNLLYDAPDGTSGNGNDIVKNSYYKISSEILNYYNIRWIIVDKASLKGNPAQGEPNMFYPAKAFVTNVIKCADEYEDDYLYACKVNPAETPEHMFLELDISNTHWIGKKDTKNGIQRFAENGAGMKLVNMTAQEQKSRLDFNLKISKPLRIKVLLNGQEVYNKYITTIGQKQSISADLNNIKPGENDITFGVFAADNSEIHSDKKVDTAGIYQVDVE